jgi:predicted dithiol-disulfide oxidoreductase (DUF899 family)
MMQHQVVSRDGWVAARKAHLAREKAFTRQRDALSAERRALLRVRIDPDYVFQGPKSCPWRQSSPAAAEA